MSGQGTAIVWFRNDLRIADNPALVSALKQYEQVLPVYIHSPDESSPWQPGEASNWWLHESLISLNSALEKIGSYLLIEAGKSQDALLRLISQYDVSAVYWNRVYEPGLIQRDTKLKKLFRTTGIDCQSFSSCLINEPHQIQNKAGLPFKVFSAFWRQASKTIDQLGLPLETPNKIKSPRRSPEALSIDQLQLLPSISWYKQFSSLWQPGEMGAHSRLKLFLENILLNYKTDRDIPSVDGTSKLSPHLHFGEISPRQVIQASMQTNFSTQLPLDQLEKLYAELGWREFGYYLLYHFPESCNQSLDSRFDDFGWIETKPNHQLLEAWQKGKTGIPIVDAGMRELWQTGWMHNRVRMITASLLTKNMGFHWLEGARWFWNTLVDADLASNTLGWQWTAGCGVDAAPYFRVFSPARQTERFDPNGEYIKKWLPELKLADKHFLMYGLSNNDTNFEYSKPIIDLAETRQLALSRWENIKNNNRAFANTGTFN